MLGRGSEHELAWIRSWRETRPAVIQLTGDAQPELLRRPRPEARRQVRAARRPCALSAARRPSGSQLGHRRVARIAGWATRRFGEPDLERLWQAVGTATRLDAPDPVAAWRDHEAKLNARAAQLTSRRFDSIRFRGPGTDLIVGLLPASRWGCATFTTGTGISHIPNLPTEEVFTAP